MDVLGGVEVLVILALRWSETLVVVGGVVALAEEALWASNESSSAARYELALHVCRLL